MYVPRSNNMMLGYLTGESIEDIAKEFNVTRERVRQCLWKVYNETYR
jgi:DNA-directed RNA polymerase sigma subunit (sigma70/sigma32)